MKEYLIKKLFSVLGLSPPDCAYELKNIGTTGDNTDTNSTITVFHNGPVYIFYDNSKNTNS